MKSVRKKMLLLALPLAAGLCAWTSAARANTFPLTRSAAAEYRGDPSERDRGDNPFVSPEQREYRKRMWDDWQAAS